MNEEYGRCKCGSVRFQSSSGLPYNQVMCNRCHMIWEWDTESGRLESPKSTFTDEALDVIIAGASTILTAYAPALRKPSLLDAMIEGE